MKRMVMIMAHQIRRHVDVSMSQALKAAWHLCRVNPVRVIEFTKMDGSHAKRVILDNWEPFVADHYATFRKKYAKPGQVFFADAARIHAGKNPVISTYKDRIIS